MSHHSLPARMALVRETIAGHQALGGWTHPVTIVAVTKTHPASLVRAAVDAGLSDVGENRVQEALEKQEQLAGLEVRWHLIGTLQRNKARQAVGRFALIHSVDRLDLATELARRAEPGTRQSVLLQVNCSGEPQKGGAEPDLLPALLESVLGLPALDLRGLMTMAAFEADEKALRRTFELLRMLREQSQRSATGLQELSMGMSGDYAIAVEEGATMVRLGSALFGERT
jgi:pyridoxal phosphate enzyme (YggS family)